jgi:hypothetical protein
MEMGVAVHSEPGVVGENHLRSRSAVGSQFVFQPEGGIRADLDPRALFRNIAKHRAFHMGDSAYKYSFFAAQLAGESLGCRKGGRKDQKR